jgi:hypothetical protein
MAYWEAEGLAYVRRGDYDWMAALVPGAGSRNRLWRGLSAALLRRGWPCWPSIRWPACLEATRQRAGEGGLALLRSRYGCTQRGTDCDDRRQPDTVVCWLMGAPAEVTGATPSEAGQQAVSAYREKLHRRVAELASRLPSVRALHLVDRTAIPGKPRTSAAIRWSVITMTKPCATCPSRANVAMRCIARSTMASPRWLNSANRTRR